MTPQDISRVRRWFGFTLKEMGDKIGAHYSTVSMLESGKRLPTGKQSKQLEMLHRRATVEMTKELAR